MSNKERLARMVPDARRDQIIEVAAVHFAREGFDEVSMARVASDAGVTRALVYHYFSGKSALLEAVLRHESELFLAATAPDPGLGAEANLRASLKAYLDRFSPRGTRVLNLHLQGEGLSSLVSRRIQENHEVQAGRILAVLGLAATPMARAVVGAWLDFVTTLTKGGAEAAEVPSESVIEVCMGVLRVATANLAPETKDEGR